MVLKKLSLPAIRGTLLLLLGCLATPAFADGPQNGAAEVVVPGAATLVTVQEPAQTDPEQLLKTFREKWDESKWEKVFRGNKYMRATGENSWKLRMTTLRSLVLAGEKSVPALTAALDSDHAQTRILAAQTLSFLGPHADMQRMQQVAAKDKDPAARLYAVDVMGTSGKSKDIDWETLLEPERNYDVRKHAAYAKGRGNNVISNDVLTTLKNWDPAKMDSAKVGSPAPDFRLKTLEGKDITLSDYRGKKNVVLVFIYGDT